jgi:hypothetical protein
MCDKAAPGTAITLEGSSAIPIAIIMTDLSPPPSELAAALAGSIALAGVHALTPLLAHMSRHYQAQLGSFSSGAGLAYVFLYMLFELARFGAPRIHALLPLGPEPLESLFILLLGSLVAHYLLQERLHATPGLASDYPAFAASFLVYNFLAGAGMVEQAEGGELYLAFYVAAIGLHLLFNDLFLTHLDPGGHHPRWRIALAAMPLVGWVPAAFGALSEGVQYAMLTVVAGGTIINIMREEMPSPRRVRVVAFLAGVLLYAGLIVTTWRF